MRVKQILVVTGIATILGFVVLMAACGSSSSEVGVSQSALSADAGVASANTDDAIRAYLESAYYSDSDIHHSFRSVRGQQVDCIDFFAQHSVKVLLAKGIKVDPSMAPKAPPQAVVANPSPDDLRGDPDEDGNARACPDGTVPATRPTVARIRQFGGVDGYRRAMNRRPPPSGSQSIFEHDCWLNDAGSSGDLPSGTHAAQYEHAVGIQNVTAYGLLTRTSLYGGSNGNVPANHLNEHNDSQLWVQTGKCDNLYSEEDPNCGDPWAGDASASIQSIEVGWIIAPDFALAGGGADAGSPQDPFLFFFFTADAYNQDYCFATGGECVGTGGCSAADIGDAGLHQGSDCWVAWPGATYWANKELTPSTLGATPPNDLVIQVWQGYPHTTAGWWVWINGNLAGWYPPNTFAYPVTGQIGPMGYGPGSYIQVGGEVYDSYYGSGGHTGAAMGSGIAPTPDGGGNYGYAAYHRNINYINADAGYTNTALTFYYAPTYEGDYNNPGLCGVSSGYWFNGDGPGAYSTSLAGAPSGQNWGNYFFFGGGEGQCVRGASPPCSAP